MGLEIPPPPLLTQASTTWCSNIKSLAKVYSVVMLLSATPDCETACSVWMADTTVLWTDGGKKNIQPANINLVAESDQRKWSGFLHINIFLSRKLILSLATQSQEGTWNIPRVSLVLGKDVVEVANIAEWYLFCGNIILTNSGLAMEGQQQL